MPAPLNRPQAAATGVKESSLGTQCYDPPMNFFLTPSRSPQTLRDSGALGSGTGGTARRKTVRYKGQQREVTEKTLLMAPEEVPVVEREVWNTHLGSQNAGVLGYRYDPEAMEAVVWQDYVEGDQLRKAWEKWPQRFTLQLISLLAVDMLLNLRQLVGHGMAHNDIFPPNVLVNFQTSDGIPHFSLIDWGRTCGFELQSLDPVLHYSNICDLTRREGLGAGSSNHYLFRSPFLYLRQNRRFLKALDEAMVQCAASQANLANSPAQVSLASHVTQTNRLSPTRPLLGRESSPLESLKFDLPLPNAADQWVIDTALMQRSDQWSVGMLLLSSVLLKENWWTIIPGAPETNRVLQSQGFPRLDQRGYIAFPPKTHWELQLYNDWRFALVLDVLAPAMYPAQLKQALDRVNRLGADTRFSPNWHKMAQLWTQEDQKLLLDLIILLTNPKVMCINLTLIDRKLRTSRFFAAVLQHEEELVQKNILRLCPSTRQAVRSTVWANPANWFFRLSE